MPLSRVHLSQTLRASNWPRLHLSIIALRLMPSMAAASLFDMRVGSCSGGKV